MKKRVVERGLGEEREREKGGGGGREGREGRVLV